MSKVILNGNNINYRRVGEGRDLVFVHGLAANHAFWGVEILLELIRNYRVTVFDLRGHGYSDMPASGYTTTDMAGDLLGLVDELEIQKATIIGHSFGGLVALQFAVMHPERVTSLVIADTRVHSLQPTNCPRDWPNSEVALKRLWDLGLNIPEDEADSGIWLLERLAQSEWREARDKLKGSPLFMPYSNLGSGARSAERWLKLLAETTARKDLTTFNGPHAEQLTGLSQKTLAIYGEYSTLTASIQGLQQYLPNCETSIVEQAGHFHPLSKPKLFRIRVQQFLDEIEAEEDLSQVPVLKCISSN